MRTVVLSLAVLASGASLRAQDAEPSPEVKREDQVNVESELPAVPPSSTAATRLLVPVEELPLTVSVVPARLARDQQAFVLSDALRNASGVNAAAGFGVFDVFTVRGFDSLSSSLVLSDGVLEPESTFYPLYDVRQVEVLKGPGAFLYGGNALAGAVQVVRKQPAPGRFAELSGTFGRYGTFAGAVDGNATSTDGTWGFRLNGTWQGTDNYREIGEGELYAIHPVLSWRPDDRTRVNAGVELLRSEQAPDAGLPFVGESGSTFAPVDRTTSYQSPFDGSEQDVVRVRLDAQRRFGNVTLRNHFYATTLDWQSKGTVFAGLVPAGNQTLLARTLVDLDDRQSLVGNQLEAAVSFSTGRVEHELLGGVEVSRLADRFVQDVGLLAPVDLLDPVEPPGGGTPITLPAFGLQGDGRSLVIAPYVVDRMNVSSSVHVFAGARLDAIDYEDPSTSTDRSDTRVSPLLGLVVDATDTLSFHLSGGTSFAPPSSQVRGPRDPESGAQVEAGAKLRFLDGKAFLGVSGYALERSDIAIPDSSGLLSQVGDQESKGLEVDLSAEPAPGFVTYASYAFTDSELTNYAELFLTPQGPFVVDRSGNSPAWVPRHLANVWISKEWGWGLGLAGGMRASSSQFAGEDNRYQVTGYTTFDASVSYRHGRMKGTLFARNLAGTEYETRGVAGGSAIPARPFELICRFDLRLGAR
jgi:iron complex outermembrane receptor protein